MSDVRYAVQIQAAEIMDTVTVSVVVQALAHDPTEKDRRVWARRYDCDPEGQPGSDRWVRDILVQVAEHL